MLLNYHIGRFALGSLCVGDLVQLGLSGVRVAGYTASLYSITWLVFLNEPQFSVCGINLLFI